MIITLDEAKQYLRVDDDEDNTLITNLISSSEDLCEGILRCPISEFTIIPEMVRQSVLYAVANLYENRENVDMKAVLDVMTRLLFAYRKDGW